MNTYTRDEFVYKPQKGYFWMLTGSKKKVIKVFKKDNWLYNDQCDINYLGSLYDYTLLVGPIEEPEIF